MTNNLDDVTMAEMIAYLHRQGGRELIREMFDLMLAERSSYFRYELVAPAIPELRATGLLTAASDLEELIRGLPHEWELKCPEQPPHDRHWREDMQKKKEAWEARNSPVIEPDTGR
jgi:hypothetical protein